MMISACEDTSFKRRFNRKIPNCFQLHKNMVYNWIIIMFATWFSSCNAQTIAQVNNLSTTLLTGYNKHTRPTNDQTMAVNVSISLSLLALRDFDEVLGKLSTSMVFHMKWLDDSMAWDTSLYGVYDDIQVSQNDVWKPPLVLLNPFDELKELGDRNLVTIAVENDGLMNWNPTSALDTTCSIDTTHYPYDKQTCKLEMFTMGFDEEEVFMNIVRSNVDLTLYEGHATWKLVSATLTKSKKSEETELLITTLTLERQPTFIIVSFLIPILVLTLLNPLVFLLPTDSGERVGYSITILLALSVFMTILADYIPQNAQPMSLGVFMLMVLYICSASMVLCAIISIKIYFISETRPINSFARALVHIGSFQCLLKASSRVHSEHNETNSNATQEINKNETNAGEKDTLTENNNMKPTFNARDITWKDVSQAFDTCSFIFMYTVVVVTSIVFLSVLQNGD